MPQLPILYWTDINNVRREIDPNTFISSKINETISSNRGANTDPRGIAQSLTGFLFPADIGLDSRADDPFAKGINFDIFEDPELAQQILPELQAQGQQAAQKFTELFNRNQKGEFKDMDDYTPAFQETIQEAGGTAELQKKFEEGGSTQVDKEGDPILDAPSYTAAFSKFRQETDGDLSAFQKAYGSNAEWQQAKSGIQEGVENRDVPVAGDKGTISEQNKTQIPYPTWASQQRAQGKPSSYNDWLQAAPTAEAGADTTTVTPTPTGEPDGTPVTVGQDDNTTLALQQLDSALANGLLDQDTYALFKTVVRNWDIDKELNMDNVLKEFDEISQSTIAPYYAEQADIFKKDLQAAVGNLEQSRTEELEAQGIVAEEKVRGTREDLARRGLTFSSEAAKQLGGKSAFGEKVPFGGTKPVGEGLVPTESRLIASGSQRGYQQAIDALGRQAEGALGQQGAQAVPGFAPRGVTQGSIEGAKQTAEAGVLSGLADQQGQLRDYQKPLDFDFNV